MRFKKGDRVKIIDNYGYGKEFHNKITTIEEVCTDVYKLKGLPYYWPDDVLQSYDAKEPVDKIVSAKPPLGLVPERFWEMQKNTERLRDIQQAMSRYCKVSKPIPLEWIQEQAELIEKLINFYSK